MIGRLIGGLVEELPGGTLLVDVAGVGYQVFAPAGTINRLTRNERGHVVFVHTHVRAEALELYGFSQELEREVFKLLINVPNVGPRTALNVLGALQVPDLINAVSSGDVRRLHQVPGIGKKTAERLVLELKEKLLSVRPDQPRSEPGHEGNRGRLIAALTNMGYRSQEAERAVKGLGGRVESEPIGNLLREALQSLTA